MYYPYGCSWIAIADIKLAGVPDAAMLPGYNLQIRLNLEDQQRAFLSQEPNKLAHPGSEGMKNLPRQDEAVWNHLLQKDTDVC